MLPYYLMLFIPIMVALIQSKGVIRIGGPINREADKASITWFFWIFMLLLMFRGVACGTDTVSYCRAFLTIRQMAWKDIFVSTSYETGYLLLCKIIGSFTSNIQVFLMVTGFISIYPLYRFYKTEAELPIVSLVLFLAVAQVNMYFSGIRQVLAMSFAFAAWNASKQKKLFRFIIIVLAAMQFHRSAFILFFIYPLYQVRITMKWTLVVVPVVITIYYFNSPIFNFLSQFLWDDFGEAEKNGSIMTLLLLIIFAVYSFLVPDEKQLDGDIFGYRNLLLLAVVIQCFAPVHMLAMRMNYYFLPFIPILIPKLINRSKESVKSLTNVSVAVMVLFFIVFFYARAQMGSDPLEIYPYVPFWKN